MISYLIDFLFYNAIQTRSVFLNSHKLKNTWNLWDRTWTTNLILNCSIDHNCYDLNNCNHTNKNQNSYNQSLFFHFGVSKFTLILQVIHKHSWQVLNMVIYKSFSQYLITCGHIIKKLFKKWLITWWLFFKYVFI